MNREYENPEMEIMKLNAVDVIKTSDGNGWVDDPTTGDDFDNDGI